MTQDPPAPRSRGGSRRARLAALIAVAAVGLAACGSGGAHVSAPVLLSKAKTTVDNATAAHFTLTSRNVAPTGTNLVGGQGDLVRPDSLQGSFSVAINGFTARVSVVSVNGIFEAKLPFASGYKKADPAAFGLTDPASLLDREKGLTRLLVLAQNPKVGPSIRVNGELLETVTFTVPGASVPVLPDANPAQPVDITVAVNPSNYQLRSVTLVGPFTSATSNSTFVVTLTSYNEHVEITLPPTS